MFDVVTVKFGLDFQQMILTTTEVIPGKKVKEVLGVVRGSTIRARWFARDIAAGLKTIVGGEIKSYSKMITDARNEAIKRMIQQAETKGGDAIICVRFSTTSIMQGSAEVMVYGTAVRLIQIGQSLEIFKKAFIFVL